MHMSYKLLGKLILVSWFEQNFIANSIDTCLTFPDDVVASIRKSIANSVDTCLTFPDDVVASIRKSVCENKQTCFKYPLWDFVPSMAKCKK